MQARSNIAPLPDFQQPPPRQEPMFTTTNFSERQVPTVPQIPSVSQQEFAAYTQQIAAYLQNLENGFNQRITYLEERVDSLTTQLNDAKATIERLRSAQPTASPAIPPYTPSVPPYTPVVHPPFTPDTANYQRICQRLNLDKTLTCCTKDTWGELSRLFTSTNYTIPHFVSPQGYLSRGDGTFQWNRTPFDDIRLFKFFKPWTATPHLFLFATPTSYVLTKTPFYYYEVTFFNQSSVGEPSISVGLISGSYPLNHHVGWDQVSIGLHSDDGKIFHCSGRSTLVVMSPLKNMDVLGCGFDSDRGTVFYTVNGHLVYQNKTNVKNWTPSIGVKNVEMIKMNVGREPFVFDIGNVIDKNSIN